MEYKKMSNQHAEVETVTLIIRNVKKETREKFKTLKRKKIIRVSMQHFIIEALENELSKYD